MSTRTDRASTLRPGNEIQGQVRKGFEPVREAFAENFSRRKELGAACCVYHHGEKVVDLWGGIRNKATGEPWAEDTMVLVFSATKGFAAMTMALLHSRGLLDYDERVCTYWPEFAQNGKQNVTVRQLLAHQAGLFAFNERVDRSVIADLDRLAMVMARQKPEWEPGTRQAYHAITLGFYEGELVRRVDPQHRTLGQFFQDEIAGPLAAEVYIRVPEELPNSRLATLQLANPIAMMFGMPFRLALASMNPRSPIYRALSSATREARWRSTTSASWPGILRCPLAAGSAALAGSRAPTTPSPPEVVHSGCGPRRCRRCWRRRFPRPMVSTTKA
jgi:CubicO group peptidase (beta-lactamase class C family)